MAAQRITGYVEPQVHQRRDAARAEDEILAREDYAKHFAPVSSAASSRTTNGASRSAAHPMGWSAMTG
jgi:hypothetical protein